jgi:hypothetical protein
LRAVSDFEGAERERERESLALFLILVPGSGASALRLVQFLWHVKTFTAGVGVRKKLEGLVSPTTQQFQLSVHIS